MNEKPTQSAAPDAWYVQVNQLLSWFWILMPPTVVGVLFHWPGWAFAIAGVVWYVLNIKVMERFIPVLGIPLVDMLHKLVRLRGGRS